MTQVQVNAANVLTMMAQIRKMSETIEELRLQQIKLAADIEDLKQSRGKLWKYLKNWFLWWWR